jgi:hypothetical protein
MARNAQHMLHTPGPWEVRTTPSGELCIIRTKDKNPLAGIAWTGEPSAFASAEKIAANARLIAAAPDLLAACKYVGCIGNTTCCEETPCHVCNAINKAEQINALDDISSGSQK